MSITLSTINPSDPISNGPSTFNANFTSIKQHIDDIENILVPSSKTLRLTSVVTSLPVNSAEVSTMVATGAAGIVYSINPAGAAATMTITAAGDIVARKVTLSGTGTNKSVIADLDITGALNITGTTSFSGLVSFTGANARIAQKYVVHQVVDANIGAAATSKVDIHKEYNVYLDYNNGGGALTGDADINLDTTNFADGQIFRLQCFRVNATGMKLHNGGVGTEIFAYIEPNGSGYTTIASTTLPEFSPSTSPDNQSYMLVQWTNIGAGTYRLVVIDSLNVTGVV